MNKFLFRDAYSKSQESQELSEKRYGKFEVLELDGENDMRLEQPDHFKIHGVVNLCVLYLILNSFHEVCAQITSRPDPLPAIE